MAAIFAKTKNVPYFGNASLQSGKYTARYYFANEGTTTKPHVNPSQQRKPYTNPSTYPSYTTPGYYDYVSPSWP